MATHDDFTASPQTPRAPGVPEDTLVYAVGDIHGRLDLLERLHGRIAADAAASPAARKTVVYLGDYVDRGADSRGVVDLLLAAPVPGLEAVHLMGNHEALLLGFLDDAGAAGLWFANGGDDTLLSYGVDPWQASGADGRPVRLQEAFRRTLPASHLVDTSASFRDRYLAVEGTVTHSHGPEGEHSHEGTAFTTWLDPQLAIAHAVAIANALSARWPEHEQDFRDGMSSVEADLQALHAALAAATARAGSRPIVASHPVYQYLAAGYDLNVRSVQWEPDELPSPSQWSDFQRLLREHPARLMLWESEPLAETSERLDSLGVTVVVFDQCGNVPAEGDFLSVMRRNVESLAAALVEE